MTDPLTGREPALPTADDVTGREPFLGGDTSIVQALFQHDNVDFASPEVLAERLASALPQLASLLQDPDQRKRSQAARLIGMVVANHRPSQEQSIPLLITVLDEAMSRNDGLNIGMAIESLGRAQNPLAVEALLQRMGYGFAGTFRSALARSGEIAVPILLERDWLDVAADICRRCPAAIPYTTEWLTPRILNRQAHPIWQYRRLIRQIDPAQLIEPMAAVACNSAADTPDRLYAIHVLLYTGDPGVTHVMFELLREQDPILRYYAVRALSEIKASSDIPKIIKLMRSPDPRMRRYGVSIAGRRRLKSAIPAILDALSDGQAGTRRLAVRALARARDSSTIPILCERIGDRAWPVRMAVVEALEQVYQRFPEHQEVIIATLRKASNDPDVQIRRAAEFTLRGLGLPLEAS